MSYSKPLPPFTFDVLCYLNRDQLERFSIVCRPLKNLIKRYFSIKPYRVFDNLYIRGGSYAFRHNYVRWHPNRDDYSVQQFLAGQTCTIDELIEDLEEHTYYDVYYSFAEMRPYLGPTVRIDWANIYVAEDLTYNPELIQKIESIAHLWHDGEIEIRNGNDGDQIGVGDFQLILKSPTILHCQFLGMDDVHFPLIDCKVLRNVKVIEINFGYYEEEIDPNSCLQFLEQSGVRHIVVLRQLQRERIDIVLERISKVFSSAISPNAFKIVFAQLDVKLTEFQATNKTSGEKLVLKEGFPNEFSAKYQNNWVDGATKYTLERFSI